jgi:hypothetical protein
MDSDPLRGDTIPQRLRRCLDMPERDGTAVHGVGHAAGHAGTSPINKKTPGGR